MAQNLREISTASLSVSPKPPSWSGKFGSHQLWGYIFAAIGAMFFSMKAIFVKLAYLPNSDMAAADMAIMGEVDAVTLLTLRMMFAVPVYILIWLLTYRKIKQRGQALPSKSLFIKAALLGCIGYYISSILDFHGLKFITAQLERLLLFTYPAFVVILGAIFFGHKVTPRAIGCIALAYSGILVVFAGGEIATGSNVALGSTLLMICAVFFALFQLMAKPVITQMGSTHFTCAAMTMAGIVVFLHFLTVNIEAGTLGTALDLPARLWGLGAAIAVFSTLLPSFLVNIALGRIGTQAVATIGMISPITTIIIAVILLGESFGPVDALGTALTIIGIGLYTWFDKRQADAEKAA